MFCYIDARVHKESRKFDARRLLDSAAQDAGPRLHLEGKLEHALDLFGAQGADLGDMAQGGGHLAVLRQHVSAAKRAADPCVWGYFEAVRVKMAG